MRRLGVAAALAAATAGGCNWKSDAVDAAAAPTAPPAEDDAGRTSRLLYPTAPASFVDLVRDARGAVVAIRATNPVKSGPAAMFPGTTPTVNDVALGTGFVVQAGGTYVVTNDHVIADVTDVQVGLLDGTELPAKILGRDPRLDLALLSIEAPRAPALRLGDSDALQVGEWVVVLGNAFGEEVTASAGIISATGREAPGSLVKSPSLGFRTYLQVDARIHRGNSGGPVLSTAGEVIGIAVATGDRIGELSFVIPSNRLREVIEPLRTYGSVRRAWLGVWARPVTRDLAEQLGLPKVGGALVTEVSPGSPAIKSGLRAGDVVLAWDERTVDHRNLPVLAANAPIGKPVKLTLWRNRSQLELSLVPEPMPE